MGKNEAVGQKSEFSVKLYGRWDQFYAKLPTDDSFFVLGETFNQLKSMIFLPVCRYIRLCVNFHVGTFRMHIRLSAKF